MKINPSRESVARSSRSGYPRGPVTWKDTGILHSSKACQRGSQSISHKSLEAVTTSKSAPFKPNAEALYTSLAASSGSWLGIQANPAHLPG